MLVALWRGRSDNLGRVLLHSHYDVVPAFPASWASDPFVPVVKDGRIYARGTQDMKCVSMQYIEAIAAIQRANATNVSPFERTIALSFTPDEEVGGVEGAGLFVASPAFQELRAAVGLDEGLANPEDAFTVFYGERAPWWVTVRANGATGHGSRFIAGTAVEKLLKFINAAMAFRAEQEARLHADKGCSHAARLGDVVTVNLTMLKAGVAGSPAMGGYALNVIPEEAYAGFDIRIPPSVPMDEMQSIIETWRGGDDSIEVLFNVRVPEHCVTNIEPVASGGTPWWPPLLDAISNAGEIKVVTEVFPAATDGRFFRKAKVPVFGFSPIRNTPILLHDHNEFLPVDVFMQGIEVYTRVLKSLASNVELP